jgi:hypothetical protein
MEFGSPAAWQGTPGASPSRHLPEPAHCRLIRIKEP